MPIKHKSSRVSSISKSEDVAETTLKNESQVVKQVVEELPSESLKEIKQDAAHIEEVASMLEESHVGVNTKHEDPEDTIEPKMNNTTLEEIYKPTMSPIAPEILMEKRSSFKSLLLWGLVVIVVATVTGGILVAVFRGGSGIFSGKPSPTPTLAVVATPSPAPVPPERGAISVQVLNGGGKTGAGNAMKKVLTDKGYTVAAVGNTDEYTYDTTEIKVKPGKEAYIDLLKADLQDTYTIGTTDSSLSSDSPYDAQVIVGKQ